jgi:hypothetical protein
MRSTLLGIGILAVAMTGCTGAPTAGAGFVPLTQAAGRQLSPAAHRIDTSGGGPVLRAASGVHGVSPMGEAVKPAKHPIDTSGGGPVLRY